MAFGGFFTYDQNNNRVDYDSFKKLVPDPIEREKITKIILNEQEGYEEAKGDDC